MDLICSFLRFSESIIVLSPVLHSKIICLKFLNVFCVPTCVVAIDNHTCHAVEIMDRSNWPLILDVVHSLPEKYFVHFVGKHFKLIIKTFRKMMKCFFSILLWTRGRGESTKDGRPGVACRTHWNLRPSLTNNFVSWRVANRPHHLGSSD